MKMSWMKEVWKDGVMFTSNPPHISSAKLSREPSEVPAMSRVAAEVWVTALIVWEVK